MISLMAAPIGTRIVSTPGTRGGKPRIDGTRITVADVAGWHLLGGMSLHEISATWDLPMASLHAAMSYYYEHREEIDRQTQEGRASADSLRQRFPSRLKGKPQVAGDG
jgi:uncharacterized protein (DUF433 family)